MNIKVFDSKLALGQAAANDAAKIIQSIAERDVAYLIAATGASQFEFLDALVVQDIDWSKVVFFHLDEYVGLPETHAASFRRYLRERIIDRIHPRAFHLINGEAADVVAECKRVGKLISQQQIDAAFVGIGENGHLAFNDPPADFETEEPYIIVDLDEACRKQQVGEGWFATLSEVPRQAISMSIKQMLAARNILCIVPDQRKAEAVRNCVELKVSPLRPASILQRHSNVTLYLDRASSSLLASDGHSR
ncbi:MAG TPA: glucosamine-6-phosphate deaminase [Pyrinomonadaceae bacterium]|nr:glucosamine-6-phosphate deaminase [Pyrinomonadaceae bacterium]